MAEQLVGRMVVRTAENSVGLMVDQMVRQKVDHSAGLKAEHWVGWMAVQKVENSVDRMVVR